MSASPKDKRIPPPQNFEDYVLSYEVGSNSGLFPVRNSEMSYVSGPAFGIQDAGASYTDDGDAYVDIGFEFRLDGLKYRKLYVNTNGWCCLIDPASTYFHPTQVMAGSTYTNYLIRDIFYPTSSDNRHALLAVWADDLRTTLRSLDEANAFNYVLQHRSVLGLDASTPAVEKMIEDMRLGKILLLPGFDESLGGVKFYRGADPKAGKCIVIRWKCFSSYYQPFNFAVFDCVLYENGNIEFRYSPRIIIQKVIYESATVGIFLNGGTTGLRYRDFGYMLKRDSVAPGANPRQPFMNGGAVYNGTYLDSDTSAAAPPGTTAKYTISLTMTENWPGLSQYGATFKFTPPRVLRRQRRSIVNLRDTVPFLRTEGSPLFNDQFTYSDTPKTVKQLVEYPSMAPVSLKSNLSNEDPTAVAEIYSSGGIQIERSFSPELSDSILYDSLVEGRNRRG